MRRRTKRQWRRLRFVLVALAVVWLVHEGRFYIPRWIRPPRGSASMQVDLKTTSYCHCGTCCSYHWLFFVPYQKTGPFSFRLKHVGKTSSGTMARPGTLAADPAVFPYGTIMHIPGYGYGRVEDTGGAIKGLHIDLYRPSHWYARLWGVRQKKVKVWLPPAAPSPAGAGEAMPADARTMDGNCVANGSTLN